MEGNGAGLGDIQIDDLQAWQPPASKRSAGRAKSAGSKTKRAPKAKVSEEERTVVLDCLVKAAEPLTKNQVLEQTELETKRWNLVINELLEAGLVHKDGAKRGTKFMVADQQPDAQARS